MQGINFIVAAPHQSWVCYVINPFCNDLLWGSEKPGAEQPLLQPPVLCLIGFMMCLNWSSPEDNRSLQCFKLNYRCCKVCSESACTTGLFPPQQFSQGKVCVHHIPCVCQRWVILDDFQPCPCSPAVPCGCSCSQNFHGDLGHVSLSCSPSSESQLCAEMPVPPSKNPHFPTLDRQSLFLQGACALLPCAGLQPAVHSPCARAGTGGAVSACLGHFGCWHSGEGAAGVSCLPNPLCRGATRSFGNLASQIFASPSCWVVQSVGGAVGCSPLLLCRSCCPARASPLQICSPFFC